MGLTFPLTHEMNLLMCCGYFGNGSSSSVSSDGNSSLEKAKTELTLCLLDTVQSKVWGNHGLHPIPSMKYWSNRHYCGLREAWHRHKARDLQFSLLLRRKGMLQEQPMGGRLSLRREKMCSALNAGQKTPSLRTVRLRSLPMPLHPTFKGEILQILCKRQDWNGVAPYFMRFLMKKGTMAF